MKRISSALLGAFVVVGLANCAEDFQGVSSRPSDRYSYERHVYPRYDDRAYNDSYYQGSNENARRYRLEREADRLRAELAEERGRHAGVRDGWTRRERERYGNLQEQLARIERQIADEDRQYGYNRRPFDEYYRRPFSY
jgi:hypothetical protein